ncbi:PCYOX1 [Symbiodinium sp. KB8]|nr:PCYOX1 [Symbiodinium sp. KB8]
MRYPGLKSAEEYVAASASAKLLIPERFLVKGARAGAAREKDRQAEKEHLGIPHWYWANLRKFKDDVKSVFKLPSDSYAGKRSVQDEIMEKVEKGQRALQETDEAYKMWLQAMHERTEEKKQEKIQQRKLDIEEAQQRKIDLQAQLQKELSEKSAGFKEKEKAYWNWLAEAKQAVQARPSVSPIQKFEVRSVEELVAEKKAALNKEVTAREQEYRSWLESVSKPKFKLPSQAVNTPAQRQLIVAESAKRGLEKLNATTAEYQKWVKDMEQEKHETMMQKVKDKLKADREDMERREFAMQALQEKMADKKADEDGAYFSQCNGHLLSSLPSFAYDATTMLLPLSMSAWFGLAAAAAAAVPRVAVVGAGINGGSAVHFLRDLLGDGVDITVFEANREPGGRTLTRSFANVTVDVGGTAIYSRNRYVSGFARDFGLQPQDRRAKESKEEVLRMYHKVHSKPLLIEQAYDYGRVFKQLR